MFHYFGGHLGLNPFQGQFTPEKEGASGREPEPVPGMRLGEGFVVEQIPFLQPPNAVGHLGGREASFLKASLQLLYGSGTEGEEPKGGLQDVFAGRLRIGRPL
jgi:hypothetical protein